MTDVDLNFREFFDSKLINMENDPVKTKEFVRYLDKCFDKYFDSFMPILRIEDGEHSNHDKPQTVTVLWRCGTKGLIADGR